MKNILYAETGEKLLVPVTNRDHIAGSRTARLTLVEYADFQCPYCGEAFFVVKELQEELGDDLRYIFRHFPLDKHPNAEPAAEAAEAAGAQGQFWEMHDLLFENQESLELEDLGDFAAELGLDESRLIEEVEDQVYADRILQDIDGGSDSGVDGTPAFFINGFRYLGEPDRDSLLAMLKES